MPMVRKGFEFVGSPQPTLGIEIELQLLDRETLDLTDAIVPLLHHCPDRQFIKPEFTQCTVEINSKIGRNVNELQTNVSHLLGTLRNRCRERGLTLCAAGTHPFCTRPVLITPGRRYLRLKTGQAYLSRRLKTFALHVHVGMPDGDTAVAVMTRTKPFLPILLALSASSPYWEGQSTGFASFRQRVLAVLRDYGMPPSFHSWHQFAAFFESVRRAGSAREVRDVHWDVRPQPAYGTLEIRVMDVQPTLRENLMLAALVHTLVVHLQRCCTREMDDLPGAPSHWWLQRENHFRASQQGLDADFIIDDSGGCRPIRQVILEMLEGLHDTGKELQTEAWLTGVARHMERGPSYLRQRRVFAKTRSLRDVVAGLEAELEVEAQKLCEAVHVS